jgi:hypothetical protein
VEEAKQPTMVNCLVNRGRFLFPIKNLSAASGSSIAVHLAAFFETNYLFREAFSR